ncbi:hypothetical protein U9R90_04915 [Streptomyces sp. E11-3]|uniref:hypothetical protein n=1 Tax=Streptomyces sp. E11-3 TaxID=3110112 RepID=UPI0039802E46
MPQNTNIDKAGAIAFARVLIGVLWLFEVTVGHNWKIGGFGSGTNPGWIGPGAGDTVRESIGEAVDDGTWQWAAWFYENAIEPNATAFSYLVIVLQVALGLFFIFGFMVRPMALLALTFDLSVFFLGNSRIPPFFSAFHLFLLYTGAGRYFGVDGWIEQRWKDARSRTARTVRWLIDLPPLAKARTQTAILAACVLLSAYFLMQIALRETPRMNMVAMDLAVLFGLVAAGLYFARATNDRFAVVMALLRIFVGYKFLHEIWVRSEPGINGLPGWAAKGEQTTLFETISDNHWGPFAWLVDTAFLPAMSLWVVVFGVVQFAVGALLILGYRTRLTAMVGTGYLGLLLILGFTRYVPFILGLMVLVLALDAGRALGLDAADARRRAPRYGLPIPHKAVPVLAVIAAANAVAAGIMVVTSGGIAPDGYTESMGQMTTAMVAIFSGMFALIGWLDLTAEHDRDRAPEAVTGKPPG